MNNSSGFGFGNLGLLNDIESRSISAENFKGEKGAGGMATEGFGANSAKDLGQGWKISPAIEIEPGETAEIADIDGPGVIRHMWMTSMGVGRLLILSIYWEGSDVPAVECPLGDFFANSLQNSARGKLTQIDSAAVAVNTRDGMNCYWPMAFRKKCRITIENISAKKMLFFYQIDYTLNAIPENAGYFHAQFRRTNPLPYKSDYTVLDRIEGKGQYVGTYMLWGSNSNGWWGEGEIKFFMDGDTKWPTICGTGTEDYFCGAWGFWDHDKKYQDYSGIYTGFRAANDIDDTFETQKRFGMYRWHIPDPIYFKDDLKVTIQAIGWRHQQDPNKWNRYLPLQDDLASVAYWYQEKPATSREPLPELAQLEIN